MPKIAYLHQLCTKEPLRRSECFYFFIYLGLKFQILTIIFQKLINVPPFYWRLESSRYKCPPSNKRPLKYQVEKFLT